VIAAASGVAAAAISVSPVRLQLAGAATRAIAITNGGSSRATVDARVAGFVLDRRGRGAPARGGRAAGWLRVRPSRVSLGPGASAVVTVVSAPPHGAAPGDHAALVLLTTEPQQRGPVATRTQVGVVAVVRVAGRIVHRLALGAFRTRRGMVEAQVANRGNVVERTRVTVALARAGRVVARLGPVPRMLLPHSAGVQRFRCLLHGWVTARVQLGGVVRTYRVRLRKG
jgi:hypothetical protein